MKSGEGSNLAQVCRLQLDCGHRGLNPEPLGGPPDYPVLPVTKGWDEVEAAVDPVVLDVLPVEPTLVSEVLLKLVVDVALDGPPAGRGGENTVV